MDTQKPDKAEEDENKMEQLAKSDNEVVSIDLPAPEGWNKKFLPRKGRTPRRNEIIFISPTGEEIKNKRQLDRYLKSHPGGPSSSDFDWGTGDSPRRSARISEKSKATETPENEPPSKRKRKSRAEEAAKKEKEDTDGEGGHASALEETDGDRELEMKDAGGPSSAGTAEEDAGVAHAMKIPDQKEKVDEMGSENPEREEAEGNKPEGQEAGDDNLPDVKGETPGEKKQEYENKQAEEQKQAVTQLTQVSSSAETPSIVGEETAKEIPSADVAVPEKEPKTSELSQESSQRKEGSEEVANRKLVGALADKENEAEAPSADAATKPEKEPENSELGQERSDRKEGSVEVPHSEEIGAPLDKENEETAK